MSIYTRKEMAMLYDASKCTGCKGCQVACKQWNVLYSNLGMNAFPFSGSYQNPEDLNGSNRLVMTFKEKKSDNQLRPVEWAFGRRSCFHCTNAGCVTVCPTGCLKYEENGVVSVSPEKCIGCTACARQCPVGAIAGEVKKAHVIDQDKCIKCGACEAKCRFKAISRG